MVDLTTPGSVVDPSATADKLLMSQADFARRRGVSRPTVTGYKKKGLLVMVGDQVDAVASDQSLADHLDPVRGGDRQKSPAKNPAVDASDYMIAKTREAVARAARQEMDTQERAGELVNRAAVELAAFTLARDSQDTLLSIADRLAPLLAAESDAGLVHELLSTELRGVCRALATGASGVLP